MGYKWLPITEDFDRSLKIKKWRYDVNNPITGNYDGALAELPNIAVEGKSGPQMSGAANGYAFENRFNAGQNFFSSRYYGWTDKYWTATTQAHTTLVSGTTYEFECPVDLYYAGIFGNVAFNSNLTNMMWFYVSATTFETDITAITATYSATTTEVTLTAEEDMAWTASTQNDWITLSTTGGTGSSVFTVSVSKNTAYTGRNGLVTLTNGENTIEITVSLSNYPLLVPKNNIYRGGLLVN